MRLSARVRLTRYNLENKKRIKCQKSNCHEFLPLILTCLCLKKEKSSSQFPQDTDNKSCVSYGGFGDEEEDDDELFLRPKRPAQSEKQSKKKRKF